MIMISENATPMTLLQGVTIKVFQGIQDHYMFEY